MTARSDNPSLLNLPHGPTCTWLGLLAVLGLCIGLRLFIIFSSTMIARDGTYYVRVARGLQDDPLQTIRSITVHPGYPAALLAVHRLTPGLAEGVTGWEQAGRIVSFLAALAATVGLWLWARQLLSFWPALIGTILFTAGRKWAGLGADVLSDSLTVCLQVWAVLAGLATLRRLREGSRSSAGWAGLAGLLIGLAYLVRFEPIVLAAALPLTWAFYELRNGRRWKLMLASTAACLAALAAVAVPYMVAIGGLTSKQTHLEEVFSLAPAGGGTLGCLAQAEVGADWTTLIDRFFEAQHPLPAFLTLGCLAAWALSARLRAIRPLLPLPAPLPAGLLAAAVLLLIPLMALRLRIGELSFRYLMLLAMLASPLAGQSVVTLAAALARLLQAHRAVLPLTLMAAGAMTAGLVVHAARPLHARPAYDQAGQYLQAYRPAGGFMLSDEPWGPHYADWPGRANLDFMPEWIAQGRHRLALVPTLIRLHNATHLLIPQALLDQDYAWLNNAASLSGRTLAERTPPGRQFTVARIAGSAILLAEGEGEAIPLNAEWSSPSSSAPSQPSPMRLPPGNIACTADLDGRGEDELVLQDPAPTRSLRAIALTKGEWEHAGVLLQHLEEGFECVGAGRFTKAGQIDLLICRQRDRLLEVVTVANGRRTGGFELGNLGRIAKVCGLADVDLDGLDDVILRVTTPQSHQVFAWMTRLGEQKQPVFVVKDAPAAWECVGWVDVNGDSCRDMIWRRRSDGRIEAWHMVGLNRLHDFIPLKDFPSRRGRPGETLRLYEIRPGPPLP